MIPRVFRIVGLPKTGSTAVGRGKLIGRGPAKMKKLSTTMKSGSETYRVRREDGLFIKGRKGSNNAEQILLMAPGNEAGEISRDKVMDAKPVRESLRPSNL